MPERFAVVRARTPSVAAIAIAIGLLGVALAARTTATSLTWIGQTFPGFVVLENRVIATISLPGWSGANAQDIFLGELIEMNGVPITSRAGLEQRVRALRPGTDVRYAIRHGTSVRVLTLATAEFTQRDWVLLFGAYLFNGAVFLGSGLLAWILRPRSRLTRAFLAFGASSALFLWTAMDLYGPADFFYLHVFSETMVPAALFQLLALFPRDHPKAGWRFAGYPVGLLLFASFVATVDRPAIFVQVLAACVLFIAAMGLLFGLRLLREYWRAESALARQRVRVVTLSTLVGLTLPGLIIVLSLALRQGVPQNAIVFTFFLFPIGLAYAITMQDFLAIDVVVKRGAYYLILTGSVALIYAGAVYVLNVLLRDTQVAQSPPFAVLFTAIALALFNPLRARLQGLVDRTFFRTGYDGAQILSDVGAKLASALRHEEILGLVETAVTQAIPNLGTGLYFDADGTGVLREMRSGRALPGALEEALLRDRIVTSEDTVELYPDPEAHAAAQSALAELQAVVAVPMKHQEKIVGVLCVGRKRSGLFFTAGDAELLRGLAHQAAIALANASSYETLVRLNAQLEDRVRARTAELESANASLQDSNSALERAYDDLKSAEVQLVQSEKMASLGRLAAGVAHEINNPVSFIASNIEPLRQRIDRASSSPPEVAARMLDQAKELIGIMAKGAQRTVAIVKDLRSFSRVNEAAWKAVDLREGLDVSIRLLETRWRDRIEIHRDYQDVPMVECEAGQMNQVFMNVLANACDAIDGRGEIWVATRRDGGDVEISIRDSGRGIPAQHLDRVFDPFFTTKDVGHGTGLGLSIVHGIVATHRGRLKVESAEGSGTTVRILLPVSSVETVQASAS